MAEAAVSSITGKPVDITAHRLTGGQWQQVEYARNIWRALPEEGVTIKDIVKPEFWAIVSTDLKRTDKIEVLPEDGSWYAELLVRDVGNGWAKVGILNHIEFHSVAVQSAMEDMFKDHEIKWKGPNVNKFCIVRKTDGEIIRRGYENQAEAIAALAEHLKTTRA